jgi:ribosomal protein L24E
MIVKRRGIKMNTFFKFAWILALYMLSRRFFGKVVQAGTNPSKENERTANGLEGNEDLAKEIHTQSEKIVEMIEDAYCGAYIPKEKAYQVIDEDDTVHYFCSWDCRQKYIQEHEQTKAS